MSCYSLRKPHHFLWMVVTSDPLVTPACEWRTQAAGLLLTPPCGVSPLEGEGNPGSRRRGCVGYRLYGVLGGVASASVPASSSPLVHGFTGPWWVRWNSPRALCLGGRSFDSDQSCVVALAFTPVNICKMMPCVCPMASSFFASTKTP